MFVISIVILYTVLLLLAYAFQERLIFHPGELPGDYEFDLGGADEEIFLETEDGETINALYYTGSGHDLVLYFHGNAGDLSNWQSVARDFVSVGYHFFIIDYRGYGKSTGRISEKGMYADARAAWDYIAREGKFTPEEIIIYGRSIGTGVAVELASSVKAKVLILEAPFSSLKSLAGQKASWLLPFLTLRFRFDNLSKINRIQSPVLFIHGSDDGLIPVSHSQTLFDAYKGRKNLVIIEGGDHNNLSGHSSYHEAIARLVP